MAIGTRIPVKSTTNQTDRMGIQPTTKARSTEVEWLRAMRRVEALQATQVMITQSDADNWRAVFNAEREAIRLCEKGHNLRGAARVSWIAGQTGLTIQQVKFYLG